VIDIVCDYNVRQAEIRFSKLEPGTELAYFGDDLGTQHALPISPAKWRKYLKRLTRRYTGRFVKRV